MTTFDHSDVDAPSQTEAIGETVGEAKWSALRELERRFPGLDKSAVEFVVLSEGERGLLGVGFVPARVIARVTAFPAAAPAAAETASPAAAIVRELLEHVRRSLALDASLSIRDEGDAIAAAFEGRDLGLVIGKHGQTIDAIQYLANAVVSHSTGDRVDIVVDAAGYRDRRRATLESLADRTAARVASSGRPEALEPMSPGERKVVHLYLKERAGVLTASEGVDPNRHVIVLPAE